LFRDLSGSSWADAAATIADDGIDILVDLAGYTQSSRPEILAMRPAPIQISWLGYLNTMGASFIDYIVADPIVVPPDDDGLYDEAVIRLPPSFLLGSPVEPARNVPSREQLGLPEEGVVYSSFNHGYKLDPALFDVWMDVLASVEGSVLWIYAGAAAVESLKAEAAARGMDGERLVFTEGIRLEDHLARQVHADVFLDAFQYNAGATGVAALMAGVPLLTVYGDRLLSRMGASLNHAVGMDELVCADLAQYRATALRIGTDAAYRQDLRERAKAARKSSVLFQPRAFARRLEEAYRSVWSRHEAGEKPGPIDISE
jgi:predicted O-linked N-acetylglucosamine transferase (SPINDLY family)